MRRKRWEARLVAFEVARALVGDGEAAGGATAERVISRSGRVCQRVSPDVFMARMGAKWH